MIKKINNKAQRWMETIQTIIFLIYSYCQASMLDTDTITSKQFVINLLIFNIMILGISYIMTKINIRITRKLFPNHKVFSKKEKAFLLITKKSNI